MDSSSIDPIDKLRACIQGKSSFVLEGGAGSGKTETLKDLLEYISSNHSSIRAVCITHTNLAVDEIGNRIGDTFLVSTIHAFLGSFIKDYKKNIHQVIHQLFIVDEIHRAELAGNVDEKEHRKEEHEKFKKCYNKYADRSFLVKGESNPPPAGKREYDQSYQQLNSELNQKIRKLNEFIKEDIAGKDFKSIEYNDTRFDDYKNLSYGHDGLLKVAAELFQHYPVLGKILQDSYDCIFVDEYQDTSELVLTALLESLPTKDKTIIGLFGDSMQGIYDDGVGDVNKWIGSGKLQRIEKEDNYRCSYPVVDFINTLRADDLIQSVALRRADSGAVEQRSDREGEIELYYAIWPEKKPTAFSSADSKQVYIDGIETLVECALKDGNEFRQLKLTNKSIASDVGFNHLYDMFSKRYVEPKEHIDDTLKRLQLTDLFELSKNYQLSNFNYVHSSLKKLGFSVKKLSDKKNLRERFDKILGKSGNAIEFVKEAFDLHLLKKPDGFTYFFEKMNQFLIDLNGDEEFQRLRSLHVAGDSTLTKLQKHYPSLSSSEYKEFEAKLRKEEFYQEIATDRFSFQEVSKYLEYANDQTGYITMHNTKGSGIENVLVVAEEYFWSKYDFQSLYSSTGSKPERIERTAKLFYVACSRAIKNLRCIRIVADQNEENELVEFFKGCKINKVSL